MKLDSRLRPKRKNLQRLFGRVLGVSLILAYLLTFGLVFWIWSDSTDISGYVLDIVLSAFIAALASEWVAEGVAIVLLPIFSAWSMISKRTSR